MPLPEYREKPAGLASKSELLKEGLRPVGEAVAVWRWYKHRGQGSGWQSTKLYARADARPPTDEQLRAERDHVNELARERRALKKRIQDEVLGQWRAEYWGSIRQFRRWATEPQFVVLDTETNGLHGHVLEVAVVTVQGEVLFQSLVKNTEALDPEAQKIHGITAEMLAHAPSFAEVAPALRAVLSGKTALAYNAEFDYKRLRQTRREQGLSSGVLKRADTACVMLEYAALNGEYDPESQDFRWVSLARACGQMGVPLQSSHRALDDALTTAALVRAVAAKDWPEQNLANVPAGLLAERGV